MAAAIMKKTHKKASICEVLHMPFKSDTYLHLFKPKKVELVSPFMCQCERTQQIHCQTVRAMCLWVYSNSASVVCRDSRGPSLFYPDDCDDVRY